MVRNYKKKGDVYSPDVLTKAISEVVNEKKSIRTVAEKYKISKSVLARKIIDPVAKKRGRKVALSLKHEQELSKHLNILAKWGFPLSKEDVKNVVREFVEQQELSTPFRNNKPGDDWFRNFCRRNDLCLKRLEALEKSQRQNTFDPFLVYGFYDVVEKKIEELNLQNKPKHIWNLDESGFSSDPRNVKGVTSKGQKVHRTIMGSGKDNTTVMACCSAAGEHSKETASA